jgi:hypothetical protein
MIISSLFIKAPGVNPGYFPLDASMNLYVERGPTGGITLFIGGNVSSGQTPLYIMGKPEASDSLDLFIMGEGGTVDASTTLVIPNVVGPTQSTGQLVLVLPNAIGNPSDIIELYIGGWM